MASGLSAGTSDQKDHPNILLLFADDLGYEALGCYGGLDFSTPHLDKLSKEGMRFSRAYTSPVCTPSRMSLYTGTYAARHGYRSVLPVHKGTADSVDFKKRWKTYPQILQKAGYETSVTGKWQLATLEIHPDHCRDAGFDSWCVWQIWKEGAKTTRYWNPSLNQDGKLRTDIADRYGPDVLADYVIKQMKSASSAGKPFYIHHNMMLPHEPVLRTPDSKASLGGMISYLDKICGRLIGAVDELGIADNTYVVFMGDNGTRSLTPRQTNEGEVIGGKYELTDAGTHIPLIVRKPGAVEAGVVASDMVDMADWFPTFCELADVSVPEGHQVDGRSFAERLLKGTPTQRTWVTAAYKKEAKVFNGQHWADWDGSPVVQVAAHRGGYSDDKADAAPENSVANVEVAIARGFDLYETDIRRTADGAFVIVHDATLDRETDGTGPVEDLTLAQFKKLRKKYRDGSVSEYEVATLEELLLAGKGRIRFKPDLKSGVISHFDELARLIAKIGMEDQVYLRTRFKDAGVISDAFEKGTPRVEVMFRASSAVQVKEIASRFSPKTIQIDIGKEEDISPEKLKTIDAALAAGILVETHCYHKNLSQLDGLIDAGVRMFHSAEPDRTLALLREKGLR